jgi:hypothetical protein
MEEWAVKGSGERGEVTMSTGERPRRSTLPKDQAKQHWIEIGESCVLEQIQLDAERLDEESIPVGPFARLDANTAAARGGRTRGAITNLFGSQAAYQAEVMARSLSAGDWIDQLEYPDPAAFPDAAAWADAFFTGESERGPHHGAEPAADYAFLWALWLSAVPYGLWSEQVRRPSLDEYRHWVDRLTSVFEGVATHFGLVFRAGTSATDLAAAVASLIEGTWLNQCLTDRHPLDETEPVSELLRRSGKLLWQGATSPTKH